MRSNSEIILLNVFLCLFENKPLNYSLKVVMVKEYFSQHLKILQQFQKTYNIPNDKVWLMPFGMTREEILKQSDFILNKCYKLNYNYAPRIHILMYNNRRLV